MRGFDIHLRLLEDCVISQTGATVGGHHGLDYIPGANLLGAVASKLYGNLDPDDQFTVFHSGRVRFGNALPLTHSGESSWPMPLCWHYPKRGKWRVRHPNGDRELLPDEVWNAGLVNVTSLGVQPKQLRNGYVALSGRIPSTSMHYEMKTAINPDTGRAMEAALFGYEALAAGTQLRSTVSIDDDVGAHIVDSLKAAFKGGIRVGRSRSAQFGRVETTVHERSAVAHGSPKSDALVVWLLADLAAVDRNGAPTLVPSADALGLGKGRLNTQKSFVRARRYSPWHGYRHAYDVERFVITQGSVLHFDLTEPMPKIDEHLGFLGDFQEAGLGAVWLNPSLLASKHPELEVRSVGESPQAQQPERPTSELIDFLEWRSTEDRRSEDREQKLIPVIREYSLLRESARQIKGLASSEFTGPSISQWGNVIAAARNKRIDLREALFDPEKGMCRPSMEGWADEYWYEDNDTAERRSFSLWLEELYRDNTDHEYIALLAREIMSLIRKEEAA